jgi:uncharacterized protein YjdB/serine/threonine protein kinase
LEDRIYQYVPLWGDWYIDSLIGEGTFGKVYKVKRTEFNEIYYAAVKIITFPQNDMEIKHAYSEGMDELSVRSYFETFVSDILKEIRIMSALKGTTNIVSIEDHKVFERQDNIGWDIVFRMELLTNLTEYMMHHNLSQETIIKLGIDICKALELCQKYNIIHRDIKPDNIFISAHGDFKLGDFGIARQVEKTTSGLSKRGTFTYMAPEVYKGEKYDATADIYSLGLMLYRLLNYNRTPFLPNYPEPITYTSREAAIAKRISGETLPAPANVEGALADIILKACAYNPGERYQSPQLMRAALEKVLQEGDHASRMIGWGENASAGAKVNDSASSSESTETIFSWVDSAQNHEDQAANEDMEKAESEDVLRQQSPTDVVIVDEKQLEPDSGSLYSEDEVVPPIPHKVLFVGNSSQRSKMVAAAAILLYIIIGSSMVLANKNGTAKEPQRVMLESLAMAAEELTMQETESQKLRLTVSPDDAEMINVLWTSDNTDVVSVSQDGEVTALAAGTATITVTAEDGSKSASCKITVEPAKHVAIVVDVTAISLNKTNTTILVDESETLAVIFNPADATNRNITWSSDDTDVATVDADGVVSAVAKGTAIITATSEDGNHEAGCTVKVKDTVVDVTGVSLNKSKLTLDVGKSGTLIATVKPDGATNQNVTWSSSNTGVATVSKNGRVTAKKAGTATITVKTVDGNKTTTCTLTVPKKEDTTPPPSTTTPPPSTTTPPPSTTTPPPSTTTPPPSSVAVTGVTLNKTSVSLQTGAAEQLSATVQPSNATNKSVNWSSSNTSVATVSSSGRVTAQGPGSANITVKTSDGDYTASCTVTVTQPVTGVTLNKSSTTIDVGKSETLMATVQPSNASNKNVTWTSSNTNVVTVDSNGKITGKAKGSAVITVRTVDGNHAQTCNVTVRLLVKKTGSVSLSSANSDGQRLQMAWVSNGYTGIVRNSSQHGLSSGYATQGSWYDVTKVAEAGVAFEISNLDTIRSYINGKGANAQLTAIRVSATRMNDSHGRFYGYGRLYVGTNRLSSYTAGSKQVVKPSNMNVFASTNNWQWGNTWSSTISNRSVLDGFLGINGQTNYRSLVYYYSSTAQYNDGYIRIVGLNITLDFEYYVYE